MVFKNLLVHVDDSKTSAKRMTAAIDRALVPTGYNVGWNCGSEAGQEVFHAHLHVIPRFADEPLAGKGIRHWLKQEENRRP